MKILAVLMLLISPAAYAQSTFHMTGGAYIFVFDYNALVYKRQLKRAGTNSCLEAVNPYSVRWTGCNNYVGQRWGTISNALYGTFRTAVTSHLNGRSLTREDGLKVYNYTGRATQLWGLSPLRLGR